MQYTWGSIWEQSIPPVRRQITALGQTYLSIRRLCFALTTRVSTILRCCLRRKPGAFLNYEYREELYPTVQYRAAYDRLVADHRQRPGVIEYLHVLKLAADGSVDKVAVAMEPLLGAKGKWTAAQVRTILCPDQVVVPLVGELAPDIHSYDQLLQPQPIQEVAHVD